MQDIATGSAKRGGKGIKFDVLRGGCEGVTRMMPMLHANMAWYAEIVVFAVHTGYEFGLVEYYSN